MPETYHITEKGMSKACEVLERDGFLPNLPDNPIESAVILDAAIEKWIDNFKNIPGDRTEWEVAEAVMLAFFQNYLREVRLQVN